MTDQINLIDVLRTWNPNLIDGISLNCRINEFGDEFALEILDAVCLVSMVDAHRCVQQTSRKNFFAPTARAFRRAASKSFTRHD